MTKSDLTYFTNGLFTLFLPNTKAGEYVWREMLSREGGGGDVIYTIQLASVLKQIRRAGYTVTKAKPITAKQRANIFAELGELIGG